MSERPAKDFESAVAPKGGSGAIQSVWDDDDSEERQSQSFEPYRDDPTIAIPAKGQTTTETSEITVESDGLHTPTDVVARETSPNLIDPEEVEASSELRSILSQQYPPTPSTPSERSRRQSYSFYRKPTPEPDLPFDFNRFQEQLRSKSAEPVAKYMKSFLHEFSKRQWNNTEQQKIIRDFLDFIRGKMLVYEPFKSASETEFDNAQEGMEKLILNRLYPDLFPPLIVAKHGKTLSQKLGHTEDLDRDKILSDKIGIYSWIREAHLDIPDGPLNERFLGLAGIEISKMDLFRAPRDKIICVLNCCKVIFGLLRNAGSEESADRFIPFLILTLLRANVSSLCSQVSFIQNFRNPEKLSGEAGYYLSSLQGAINFIEALDRQSLTISDQDYEENVEKAVRRIKLEASVVPPSPSTPVVPTISRAGIQLPSKDLVFEKATGLLNIAKPSLSAVGRLFSHDGGSDDEIPEQHLKEGLQGSLAIPDPRRIRKPRTSQSRSYIESGAFGSYDERQSLHDASRPHSTASLSTSAPTRSNQDGEAAGATGHDSTDRPPVRSRNSKSTTSAVRPRVEISASEAIAAKEKERQSTLNMLCAMFENVETGVIEMVLDEKRGKVGACIDTLLEIGGA